MADSSRKPKRAVRADEVLLPLVVLASSIGLGWLLVYKLGWRSNLIGLLDKALPAEASFVVYALLIGLGFGIAVAPLRILERVYKKRAGPDGDTGVGPL